MIPSILSVLLLAAASTNSVLAHTPYQPHHGQVPALPLHHDKRQNIAYIPAIISYAAGTNCSTEAAKVTDRIARCLASGGTSELEVAKCSCADETLNTVHACSTCIVEDPGNTNGNTPLTYYNAFVNQCVSLTLANGTALTTISGETVTTATAQTTLDHSSHSPLRSGFATASGASLIVASDSSPYYSGASATNEEASATTTSASPSQTSGAEMRRWSVGAAVIALVLGAAALA